MDKMPSAEELRELPNSGLYELLKTIVSELRKDTKDGGELTARVVEEASRRIVHIDVAHEAHKSAMEAMKKSRDVLDKSRLDKIEALKEEIKERDSRIKLWSNRADELRLACDRNHAVCEILDNALMSVDFYEKPQGMDAREYARRESARAGEKRNELRAVSVARFGENAA